MTLWVHIPNASRTYVLKILRSLSLGWLILGGGWRVLLSSPYEGMYMHRWSWMCAWFVSLRLYNLISLGLKCFASVWIFSMESLNWKASWCNLCERNLHFVALTEGAFVLLCWERTHGKSSLRFVYACFELYYMVAGGRWQEWLQTHAEKSVSVLCFDLMCSNWVIQGWTFYRIVCNWQAGLLFTNWLNLNGC